LIKSGYINGLVKKNYFTKALSLDRSKRLNDNLKIWSYYNLSMHKSASQFSNNHLKCKGLMAKIISLASCGEFKEAKDTLSYMTDRYNCKKLYIRLIDSLIPFMPKDALVLLETLPHKPITLYVALLLKLGEIAKVKNLLRVAINQKEYRKFPELLLYTSNALKALAPKEQLTYINKYLLHFKLPKLYLKDRTKSCSTLNIGCRENKKVTGPLVSVIMTTFNIGERIDIAIESILNQTYINIELIIVDDKSSDNTVAIIEEWMKKDQRVKLLQLQKNVGTYVAKNIALLQIAKGEFVTCHDSDDWSHPLKIQRQVEPLKKNRKLVASISSWVRLDDAGKFYARPVHPLMRQNPSSLLFRREKVLKKVGIWDSVRTGADSEYIERIKLVFGRKKVLRIKEPLSFGAHRKDSLMTASSTGFCDLGISSQRLEYWEAWRSWHIDELRAGKKPYLLSESFFERKFEAPATIIVPKADIEKLLNKSDILKVSIKQ